MSPVEKLKQTSSVPNWIIVLLLPLMVTIFLTMTPATTFAVNSSSGTPRITALPFTPAVFSAGNFVINQAGVAQTYFLTATIHTSAWILLPSFAATSNVFYFAGFYYV